MTRTLPLVSVIIPCYNQAGFLGEAVSSVLRQTYSQVEIIVVDDGSTDAPERVVARYENVRLIRQENQGPAAARNTGLRASTGRYIVFLDGDDRLLPQALEIGVHHLNAQPDCAFVSGHCQYIASDGSALHTPPQPNVHRDHYQALLHRNFIWAGSTIMHRRECLEAVAGYNAAPQVQGAEDYDLYLRLARLFPIFCHGKVIAEYRQYDESAANVSNNPRRMLQSTISALHAQRRHLKNNKAHRQVYRLGIRHKQQLWGGLLLEQVKGQLLTRGARRQAMQNLWTLIKYNKRGLLARFIARLRRLHAD
jgi:glycosyltransferase involved in cell wall biosynthesis